MNDPNFIHLPNSNSPSLKDWKAIIGPGGGQAYWKNGHPLVESLFHFGVSSILSLDLKLRIDRSPNEASEEIVNELITILTPTAPNKLIFTGYSTGGMILFKALHDGGDKLRKLIDPESVILMIGVAFHFLNPQLEKFIHAFWTVESSKRDKTRLEFLEKNHGNDWPKVVVNCGKWMERYSGLFLEPDEMQKLIDSYSNIMFIMGEKEILEDTISFFNRTESAKMIYVIPKLQHFSYFSSENWKTTESLYKTVLNLYIPKSKI